MRDNGIVTWSVSIDPPVQGDLHWRGRILERLRPELERRLRSAPETTVVTLADSILTITLRRIAGSWREGAQIRLNLAGTPALTQPGSPGSATPVFIPLPDDRIAALGERLIGLNAIQEAMVLGLRCRWDGVLEQWSQTTGSALSPAMRAQFEERAAPIFILAGDPGTGKSVTAQVVAERYCREAGVAGKLFYVGTEVRGNGLVGDFGNRIRSTFAAIAQESSMQPCFVVIDEADAVAMRRSEQHAHQEDRAGTATLLQVVDAVPEERKLALFLTTNQLYTVDAAIRRRGVTFIFPLPDRDQRRALISPWLPVDDRRGLERAAKAANGMTPADIQRALAAAVLTAVRNSTPFTTNLAIESLASGERTGEV